MEKTLHYIYIHEHDTPITRNYEGKQAKARKMAVVMLGWGELFLLLAGKRQNHVLRD